MLNGNSQTGEVFVVDDDPMVLNALTVFLTREGYQVAGFSDGASFLDAARSRTPICIILDVQMPGQTGHRPFEGPQGGGLSGAGLHRVRKR